MKEKNMFDLCEFPTIFCYPYPDPLRETDPVLETVELNENMDRKCYKKVKIRCSGE